MIRDAEIARAFALWLESYSPPRNIAGNADLMQREASRLAAALVKHAPNDGYLGWVDSVLESVSVQMKTRAWPTVAEIHAAASSARAARRECPAASTAVDHYELNANRMKAGERVGEGYLYGKEAVEMIARGLIDQETMTNYRSAAFLARKAIHGEESALAWEADCKARHEDARQIHKIRKAAA